MFSHRRRGNLSHLHHQTRWVAVADHALHFSCTQCNRFGGPCSINCQIQRSLLAKLLLKSVPLLLWRSLTLSWLLTHSGSWTLERIARIRATWVTEFVKRAWYVTRTTCVSYFLAFCNHYLGFHGVSLHRFCSPSIRRSYGQSSDKSGGIWHWMLHVKAMCWMTSRHVNHLSYMTIVLWKNLSSNKIISWLQLLQQPLKLLNMFYGRRGEFYFTSMVVVVECSCGFFKHVDQNSQQPDPRYTFLHEHIEIYISHTCFNQGCAHFTPS